jgi:hypothetical protein
MILQKRVPLYTVKGKYPVSERLQKRFEKLRLNIRFFAVINSHSGMGSINRVSPSEIQCGEKKICECGIIYCF